MSSKEKNKEIILQDNALAREGPSYVRKNGHSCVGGEQSHILED